jgi:hypothetical protein
MVVKVKVEGSLKEVLIQAVNGLGGFGKFISPGRCCAFKAKL